METITYSSNNSGGDWWLEDKDWIALEKAGWLVEWGGSYFCKSRWDKVPKGKPEPCASNDECKGHRKYDSAKEAENDRWLGALAKEATKPFEGTDRRECVQKAIREFEKVTGADLSAEGCNCCGTPHTFEVGKCFVACECKGAHEDMHFIHGEEFLDYLSNEPIAGKSKRELLGL